eukprot:4412755-Heterocapsa_arctica.AAC.1
MLPVALTRSFSVSQPAEVMSVKYSFIPKAAALSPAFGILKPLVATLSVIQWTALSACGSFPLTPWCTIRLRPLCISRSLLPFLAANIQSAGGRLLRRWPTVWRSMSG